MNKTAAWAAGWLATWVILTGMAESSDMRPLAAGLAVSTAIAATYILGPKAFPQMAQYARGGVGNATGSKIGSGISSIGRRLQNGNA